MGGGQADRFGRHDRLWVRDDEGRKRRKWSGVEWGLVGESKCLILFDEVSWVDNLLTCRMVQKAKLCRSNGKIDGCRSLVSKVLCHFYTYSAMYAFTSK